MKNSFKLGKASLHRPAVDQKFWQNFSMLHCFLNTCIFVFCKFCEKFKMATTFDGTNFFFFLNWVTYSAVTLWFKISSKLLYLAGFSRYKHFLSHTPWVKILTKSLYLAWFSRYKHLCVLQFLAKNLKIQNGRHFLTGQKFLKTGSATQQMYPVDQKFRQNCSI